MIWLLTDVINPGWDRHQICSAAGRTAHFAHGQQTPMPNLFQRRRRTWAELVYLAAFDSLLGAVLWPVAPGICRAQR
jgi:hypothetical protein